MPDTAAAANAAPAAPATPGLPAESVATTVNAANAANAANVSSADAGEATSTARNSDAPAVVSNRQSATQGLSAGRDVKFLNVFVVSGGIRMPATTAPAGMSAATESSSN